MKGNHKKLKIALIVLLVIVIILSIVIGVFAYELTHLISDEVREEVISIYKTYSTDAQTIDSVHDLAVLTSISCTIKGKGPITVTPAKLNGEEITLITLGGTQNREGQATRMKESELASKGQSNDYLKAVVKLFNDGVIPSGKPLLITGISLGGMIAQQLLAESIVTDNYEIKAVVTFGSPLTAPLDRKGVKVVRFNDKHDVVPKLGESNSKIIKQNKELVNKLHESERIIKEGAHTRGFEAHAMSYISDEVWNEFDFLGDKNKVNTLETLSPLTFYEAPILE